MSDQSIPRPEHPRPHCFRPDWINLNGVWSFSFDFGRSGVERGFHRSTGFDKEIVVPFCPESKLSGIQHTDYLDSIWYHRPIDIPDHWYGRRVIVHFGAVDYEAHIYLDGRLLKTHYGGSSSFAVDLTSHVRPGGRHHLVVNARDDIRRNLQPGGKQSVDFYSSGCFYTRVSGIWQTVWLEAIDPSGLLRFDTLPDFDSRSLTVLPQFFAVSRFNTLRVTIYEGDQIKGQTVTQVTSTGACHLPLDADIRPWSPHDPCLYHMTLEVVSRDGALLDRVDSYVGIRKLHAEGNTLFLNNEPLYQRLVLDQGYYENGIWTAPSDDALRRDIELSLEAGFNGARLHQKVFEERFHYWADQLGYLTWAESPSWGLNLRSDEAARNFLVEWREVIMRDKHHPSIVAWTPLNETWDISDPLRHRRLHIEAYELTKTLDSSRPVNGASGGCQVITDLYTVHNYEQDPDRLYQMLAPQPDGSVYATLGDKEVPYSGQPYFVDEFGGIKWIPSFERPFASDSWGYGEPPRTEGEFYARLEGQVEAILSLPHIAGYCYTQLTDVEQEQNGIYNYDRSVKFHMHRLRQIFGKMPSQVSTRR